MGVGGEGGRGKERQDKKIFFAALSVTTKEVMFLPMGGPDRFQVLNPMEYCAAVALRDLTWKV